MKTKIILGQAFSDEFSNGQSITSGSFPTSKRRDNVDFSKSDYQKTSTEILKLYIVSELEKVTDNLQFHDADLESRILEKEDYESLKQLINILK